MDNQSFLPKVVLFSVLIGLILAGYFLSRFVFKEEPSSGVLQPKGVIYLTLRPHGGTAALYRYNIENNVLEKFSNNDYLTSKISPDGQRIAYVASRDGENVQIFVSESANQGGGATQYTNSTLFNKRSPQWSPDGAYIAFQAREELGEDLIDLENWSVYITDENANEKLVAVGAYPTFLPDSRLLVMKASGVYVYDINGNQQDRIIAPEADAEFNASMKMALSKDKSGRYFALTHSEVNKVYLYRVSSWASPVDIETVGVLEEVKAFWPVFSPDSKFLALQEIDVDTGLASDGNPRIVIYDIETLDGKIMYVLNDFIQDSMFISEWRY